MPLFEASHRLELLDYFRVPYRVTTRPDVEHRGELDRYCGRLAVAPAPDGAAEAPGTAATFWWLRSEAGGLPRGVAKPARYVLNSSVLCGRLVPDRVGERWVGATSDGWRPVEPILDSEGRRIASVWRHADGSIFLPFDPGEAMQRLWSEAYDATGRTVAQRVRTAVVRIYYAVRPALPRGLQLALRRAFSRLWREQAFPRWPVETALHDLYDWLLGQLADWAGRPVPWLAPWPDGRSWALVLTHDIETSDGCRRLHLLRDIERELGYISSWNFVPLRYAVSDEVHAELRAEGCEIGVHGLLHDGRDLGSRRLLERRLPQMRAYAQRWGAVGFRAPATQRRWEWMRLLGFDYDTSYHDTAPYEPTPGGCCSYLPYFNGDTVELPITLPQDHTLFAILQHPDETIWMDKMRHVRSRGGMVLVLTHPDYADDPRLVHGYRRLLETVDGDPDVWRALPREVSAWWRRRAQSTLEEGRGGWTIRGPAAADGTVRFVRPATGQPAGAR